MAKSFIGRKGELTMIEEMWQSPKAELIILYGRRRVGKTRLLTHWMHEHQSDGLYWMAEPSSAVDQLRSFSQALANFADPDDPAPLNFTYATWEQALKQVALLAKGRRFAFSLTRSPTSLIPIRISPASCRKCGTIASATATWCWPSPAHRWG